MISTNYMNLTSKVEFHEDLIFLQSYASDYTITLNWNLRLLFKG